MKISLIALEKSRLAFDGLVVALSSYELFAPALYLAKKPSVDLICWCLFLEKVGGVG